MRARIPVFLFSLLSSVYLLTITTGCRKSEDIHIEEEKMVAILADLNISDQIIRRYPAIYRDSIREVLTQSLLKIHDITQDQLDTNLYLYQIDLERYKDVSEKVVRHLESMQ